ncbi:hypothetical protein F4859DRAFT_223056 [Xylaria cf. heliscus]|nr:hypothetical protein F4859DRAFT_223056 [Xylaria cf. heliscus]
MSLITIKQSFAAALPSYQSIIGSNGTHLSGSVTVQTDPPKFCVIIPRQSWESVGRDGLNRANNTLDSEYMYLRENAMIHANEGDVARAAAMYLIHPINQALSAILPPSGQVKCFSEKAEKTKGVCCDIGFKKMSNLNPSYFAVVEYKRRGIIKDDEFAAASRTITEPASITKHVEAAYNDKKVEFIGTFFKGNSRKLMKRASAYAIQYNTKYVALFDWDRLVLIHFLKLNTTIDDMARPMEGIGDYCEISMIKDTESHAMRVALLGFLLRAYQDTL